MNRVHELLIHIKTNFHKISYIIAQLNRMTWVFQAQSFEVRRYKLQEIIKTQVFS